eukprot:GILJ01001504.1.p1 GENE.GILJ01001504.1~~GILJ01001504.1.p1  ORF type:complete len:588 (+),score=83.74 GILJ01001504.1:261-1766(+)
MTENVYYTATYTVSIPSNIVVTSEFSTKNPIVASSTYSTKLLPHANVHSCFASTVALCTPFISNVSTLSTHTAAQSNAVLNAAADYRINETFTTTIALTYRAGGYVIIGHARFFENSLYQWDVAIAAKRVIQKALAESIPASYAISIGYAVASIGGFVSVILMAIFLLYQKHKVVRFSQPGFCLILLTGAMLLFVSVYMFTIPVTDTVCTSRMWTFGLGFVILMGSITAKVHRISQIMKNTKKMRRTRVTVAAAATWLIAFLTAEVIILAVWQAISPLKAVALFDSANAELYRIECDSTYQTSFMITNYFWKGFVILLACTFAYKAREASTLLSEGKHFGNAIYSLMIICVLVIPVQYTLGGDPSSLMLLRTVGIFLGTCSLLLGIFGYRLYLIVMVPESQLGQFESTSHTVHGKYMTSVNSNQTMKDNWTRGNDNEVTPINTVSHIPPTTTQQINSMLKSVTVVLEKHDNGLNVPCDEVEDTVRDLQSVINELTKLIKKT